MKNERVTLIFSAERYGIPITYHLVKDFDLRINILKAEITPGEEGYLLLDLEGSEENLENALQFLRKENIKVRTANKQIVLDKDACVHCGACTAVCFSQAMVMNPTTWEVEFHSEKCIVCGLCIDACPTLSIRKGYSSPTDDE